MRAADIGRFSWQALSRHRFRSAMVLLSMAVGVASVVVLTALGEGARHYVLAEFDTLGKDVLIVFPGRKETTGGLPPVTGMAARDLTLDDAHHLARRLSAVEQWAPLVLGSAEVSYRGRSREVMTLGTTAAFVALRQLRLSQGRNIGADAGGEARGECLAGQTIKAELFGPEPIIGARIRVGDYRCRVVGVLAGRGDAMGLDLSDAAIMPVAAAQRLFNAPGLFRLLLRLRPGSNLAAVKQGVEEVLQARHGQGGGAEDVGYLLSQNLTVADRRAHETDLLRAYHDALVGHGVSGYSFESLQADYEVGIAMRASDETIALRPGKAVACPRGEPREGGFEALALRIAISADSLRDGGSGRFAGMLGLHFAIPG